MHDHILAWLSAEVRILRRRIAALECIDKQSAHDKPVTEPPIRISLNTWIPMEIPVGNALSAYGFTDWPFLVSEEVTHPWHPYAGASSSVTLSSTPWERGS